jgi:2-(1,2-epoxy-1,2-dihydrophenyl)acetyl-CoA isomerase
MSVEMPVRFQVDDGVGVVTLADPAGINTLSEALLEGLGQAVQRARDDAGVRALLIQAEGRAFCAGADLEQIRRRLDNTESGDAATYIGYLMERHGEPLVMALRALPMVVVCAVGGAVAGGGVGLALAADVVIASRGAYFALPFVPSLGLIPDLGATYRLTKAIGRPRALALALTGQKFSAEQAANWGLVWRCVADDSLASEAMALARGFADLPPTAIKAAKELFDNAETADLSSQLRLETKRQRELAGEESLREGVSAFLDRRKPRFLDLPRQS